MSGFINQQDDKLLWDSLKAGNKEAFALLYRRYVRVLYSYGKKVTRDEKLVEDSIQDLFIDLWQSRENLGEAATVRFYLFRSLRRKICRSHLKHASLLNEDPDEGVSRGGGSLESRETFMIGVEEAERNTLLLNNLIRHLPARQGEALLLYYYEGFDYQQIAALLSINEQSARNLVQRALGKLKKYAASVRSPLSLLLLTYLAALP